MKRRQDSHQSHQPGAVTQSWVAFGKGERASGRTSASYTIHDACYQTNKELKMQSEVRERQVYKDLKVTSDTRQCILREDRLLRAEE